LDLVIQWEMLNPTVQSMYTMRRTPSGAWRFVLAPAADLNLDGKIEGVAEETDPIGLLYTESIPEMDEAWAGKVVFQRVPSEDQWGSALTVFCPLLNSQNQVEAIFGIDFDAPTLAKEIHGELFLIVFILWLLQILCALGCARLWLSSQVAFHTKTERELLAGFANTDGLTGLHNRRFLEMRFAQEMDNDPAVLNPRALLIFDIDRYKRINDTWGHLVGDQVLIDLASLLREQLRGRDVIARWGGDEFVVLLLETNGPEAEHVAELLRRRVEMRPFPPTDGVTCSFGLAGIHPNDTLEEVMKRADQALYQVKENGRNGVISDF
jgi:diguanylate cyclase (GGDEF)-like protein